MNIYYSEYEQKRDSRRKEKIRIKKAMEDRKANCYDYSLIFKEICELLNIESQIIIGYSKGDVYDIAKDDIIKNHAWNSVKIHEKWELIDVSWAVGYDLIKYTTPDNYYYIKSPEEFINQHLPSNPKWQLLPKPISKKEFLSFPILYPEYFNSTYKLSDESKGIYRLTENDRNFIINFDKIEGKYNLSYAFLDDVTPNYSILRKNENGSFRLKIKCNKNQNSYFVIFSNLKPLIGYKTKLVN